MDKRRIRNLGILAHVDAGKTTLTEQMLFNSGSIKSAGNVDKGTSHTDLMPVEKERGISVRAASVSFEWKGVQINLIDTPGHVDFSAEVERSLRVLDCAVLVISAVEGIQAQTETIWNALREMKIPTMIFINKVDRIGACTQRVMNDLKHEFREDFILLNYPVNEAESHATTKDNFTLENESLIETISEHDDILTGKYLNEEKVELHALKTVLKQATISCKIFPVLCGVSKNNIAVEELLDMIIEYFPDAVNDVDAPVSGVVYKIEHDPKLGRIAGVRLFAGTLKNRDIIKNYTANRDEKVSQIKKYFSDRFEDTSLLEAGDIAFISGMPEVMIGDILGDPSKVPGGYSLVEPLLTVKVMPMEDKDYSELAEALQKLSSEDPHLNFTWFKEDREMQVNIMGPIQIEILTELLQNKFNLGSRITPPTVIYKETPAKKGYGSESYTMPKPCWAVVKFEIEPGEPGSGISYSSEVGVNDIERKYQNEIEMILPEALKQGIKGWNVTDIKIKLVDGEHHVVHSRPGDFKLATMMGIMRGLENTDTKLLEPIIAFRISAPEEYLGKVTSDIINMRGSFDPVEIGNGSFTLRGKYPLSTSLDYSIRLNSLTSGKAKLSNNFDGYELCPTDLGVVRNYKGINPLDRSKFILKWRGAIRE
ncbi:MAG: TetM/TetW/TetO/TetS family tetracycline resistance ribosomal protection protein [Bacteroidetes bacterium]|nr:TetM/TetW/TetO/TetS family tetracycline resistance ribosomal protection protein [Bacteroidota bacterium]